ncbi:MAG: hypothetical protein ABFR89_04600 [Actinomycetota bacterium]
MTAPATESGSGTPSAGNITRDVPPPEYLQVGLGRLSEFQAEILADNAITHEEYESAYLEYAECAEAAGAPVQKGPWWDPEQRDFHVWVIIAAEEDPGIQGRVDSCWSHSIGPLQDWWIWQQEGRPTDAELVEQDRIFMERLVGCLQQRGIDIPDDPSPQDLETAYGVSRSQYHECLNDAGS